MDGATFGRTVQWTIPDSDLCERFCGEYLTYLSVLLVATGLLDGIFFLK